MNVVVKDDLLTSIKVPDTKAVWLKQIRDDAWKRVQATGLPQTRDEYWRYTKPMMLSNAPQLNGTSQIVDETNFDSLDPIQITFHDGVLDASALKQLNIKGLDIQSLSMISDMETHWASNRFGVIEEAGQSPVARPLAMLNRAVASEGIVIKANTDITRPIVISYIGKPTDQASFFRHFILVEKGASLTLIENGTQKGLHNQVLEVDVADNASFHHVRSQGRDSDRRTNTHLFARLGESSCLKSFTLTMNGELTRNDYIVEFLGDNAHATVAGASAGDGDTHHDDTVFITHDSVNCESRQVFKKILRNGAVGVFQGKILVKSDAQKTDGYQISQGLLLDDDSQFLAKPELEIYADDVVCSHGSTVGAIDSDMLFYLISRGVPKRDAENMLVLAFLNEAIDEIEFSDIKDIMHLKLDNWLGRHGG